MCGRFSFRVVRFSSGKFCSSKMIRIELMKNLIYIYLVLSRYILELFLDERIKFWENE